MNPYFEPAGFDRLEAALVQAARREVTITVVSSNLVEPASVNYGVISNLLKRALAEGLNARLRSTSTGKS